MNYIGSKNKLSPWIFEIVNQTVKGNLTDKVFADIFAGTGQVARYFKDHVQKVICNDLEAYSYALNRHYVGNSRAMDKPALDIKPVSGNITNNFSPASSEERMYYTTENAQLIDGIRGEIEKQYQVGSISEDQYFWLLCSLIEAADKVANTASVYGAYLKKFKKSALAPLSFDLVDYKITDQDNEIYNDDANNLIGNISGDILYLDPPYNARQYGANYHVLNRIVENKPFTSDKKTGLIDYNKSDYCRRASVEGVFEDLIARADFEYIFISYNNEGLIPEERFKEILRAYGDYSLHLNRYRRFKADSSRNNKADHTFEHLHCLIKR